MAFNRCWCGHYSDQHDVIPGSEVPGRCLAKSKSVPSCTCGMFKVISDAPEGTDIYRDDSLRPGYHIAVIERGVLGELSKVQEELDEAKDAASQGVKIMELVELSDMIGAVIRYLEAKHPGTTLDDLIQMHRVTRRAFENGHRAEKER